MGSLAKSLFGDPSLNYSQFLDHLLADYSGPDFQLRLWDGTVLAKGQQPRFTLILKHPGGAHTLLHASSELALGEAYVYDDFDIQGDIEAAFVLADYLLARDAARDDGVDPAVPKPKNSRLLPFLLPTLPPLHSRERDRQAISYHYDLPAEFYALWLDSTMVYSCAYFSSPDEDLDLAQRHKLDYICRKLRLRPGERLLDIGCGWGSLIMHAASNYGVDAVGITISVPQAELARQRLRAAGLNHRCRVEVADYRDIEHDLPYDKLVSVGMFEHVGERLLPGYFRCAWNLLRPGGVFLNHGISYSATYRRRGASFIDHYVFPDGELVPINTSLRAAELSGFEVRDVESLREHYALTLHHWVQRLDAHSAKAHQIADDTTYRIWRLYMAGAAHAFRRDRLNLYQTLLAKPLNGDSGLPLTREDWYRV
jgi:cyclopropane-fatty-acyl-phospholipid synthase